MKKNLFSKFLKKTDQYFDQNPWVLKIFYMLGFTASGYLTLKWFLSMAHSWDEKAVFFVMMLIIEGMKGISFVQSNNTRWTLKFRLVMRVAWVIATLFSITASQITFMNQTNKIENKKLTVESRVSKIQGSKNDNQNAVNNKQNELNAAIAEKQNRITNKNAEISKIEKKIAEEKKIRDKNKGDADWCKSINAKKDEEKYRKLETAAQENMNKYQSKIDNYDIDTNNIQERIDKLSGEKTTLETKTEEYNDKLIDMEVAEKSTEGSNSFFETLANKFKWTVDQVSFMFNLFLGFVIEMFTCLIYYLSKKYKLIEHGNEIIAKQVMEEKQNKTENTANNTRQEILYDSKKKLNETIEESQNEAINTRQENNNINLVRNTAVEDSTITAKAEINTGYDYNNNTSSNTFKMGTYNFTPKPEVKIEKEIIIKEVIKEKEPIGFIKPEKIDITLFNGMNKEHIKAYIKDVMSNVKKNGDQVPGYNKRKDIINQVNNTHITDNEIKKFHSTLDSMKIIETIEIKKNPDAKRGIKLTKLIDVNKLKELNRLLNL